MSAAVKTIQNGNQLPQKWTGPMHAASARTLDEAQAWADGKSATVAYWIEPSKTVYAIKEIDNEQLATP